MSTKRELLCRNKELEEALRQVRDEIDEILEPEEEDNPPDSDEE
jgi:hypothetical protein